MAHLTFRARIALAFTATVLLGIFLLFALGNYYVNSLQKRNVEAAMSLAKEQAQLFRDEVLALLNDYPDMNLSDPYVRERMKQRTEVIMTQNKNVVWAAVIDPTGVSVVQDSADGAQVIKPLASGSQPQNSKIPTPGGDVQVTVRSKPIDAQEIREPIRREGQPVGEIRLRVSNSPAVQRIETTSRQITSALVVESGLFLLFVVAVFIVLWALFSRQVRLVQRNAALDQMAYVGTLASGLAHEIRNPLSAMNVNLQVMQEELQDENAEAKARASDLAMQVQREVGQLNSTLTSFLDFALPAKESFSRFSLGSMLQELFQVHAEEMKQAGITYELDLPSGADLKISGDEQLIHRALRNIVMNAMQAVAGSVKRHIRATVEVLPKRVLRVVVADTGSGIPSENLTKIFEVFFSTKSNGSGFGLAITRKIVEGHRGSIRAENNTPNLGVSFIIELPQDSA